MLLDKLHPDWVCIYMLQSRHGKNSLDFDGMSALIDFAVVPADYLALVLTYGTLNFASRTSEFTFFLRHPVDAHDFHFGQKREQDLPGMYPMTASGSAKTLYYGTIDAIEGVYLIHDGVSLKSRARYVANNLFDILFKGAGADILQDA